VEDVGERDVVEEEGEAMGGSPELSESGSSSLVVENGWFENVSTKIMSWELKNTPVILFLQHQA
jgi:hypothetical protein